MLFSFVGEVFVRPPVIPAQAGIQKGNGALYILDNGSSPV
jgi:hypothetical protein